jgi:hypothetical protein
MSVRFWVGSGGGAVNLSVKSLPVKVVFMVTSESVSISQEKPPDNDSTFPVPSVIDASGDQ